MSNQSTKMKAPKLLAPNGKPSNLTAEQYRLVRTDAFISWFGDWINNSSDVSKVVDENGEPLVVYHGTYKDFYVFGKGQKFKDIEYIKNTNYFHKSKKYAEKFGFEKPYFLNVKNIELINQDTMEKFGYSKDVYDKYVLNGVDGVYSKDGEYATIISANQIKLADGTNTIFDSNNPDIRYEFGGKVYNGVPVGYSINPNMVISAFANPVDEEKIQEYTAIMKEQMLSHDFPPIMGFPIIIGEEDLGKQFMNGEEVTEEFFGQRAWMVTDGHHRVFSALEAHLPMLEVELDYSTVTNMKEYYGDGGLVFKKKKGTEKEHAHTEVYLGEEYLGYYMPNESKFAEVNENWNFVSKHEDYPNLKAKTKKELISKINSGNHDIRFKDGGLVDVKPIKYVYHQSNPKFRDKIKNTGLLVQGKSEAWLSDTEIDGEVIFATNSSDKKDWFDSTFDDDVYEIDTTYIKNKWYKDPNFLWDKKSQHIITFENIPTNAIKLIYEGTGESNFKNGGEVTFDNFYLGTYANFEEISESEIPDREPDFISDSGSKYWHEGEYVYRRSNHWGAENMDSCDWELEGTSFAKFMLQGKCKLSDFKKIKNKMKDGGKLGEVKPEPKFKKGQKLKLKGYGEVKVYDLAWLTPPLSPRVSQYIYDFKIDPKSKRNDLSFWEYELEMMLEDYDMDVDYEASYEKYLSEGVSKIGNPPMEFNKFIARINQSIFYGEHPELEPRSDGFAKVSAFADAYAIHKYSNGGEMKTKTKTIRITDKDVKKKSESIGTAINRLNQILRWHEGKKVKYPITDDIERKVIQEYMPLLRRNREKIYSLYLEMKDNKQKTIVDSATKVDLPNMRLFNLVKNSVEMKYILNYCEINKTQKVDDKFYSSSELSSFEKRIEQYMQDMIEEYYGKTEEKEISVEPKKKEVVGLTEIEKKAIADLIEYYTDKSDFKLTKYARLTQEEGEYLYGAFRNYEDLINEYGEYVAKIKYAYDGSNYEETKEADEKLEAFLEVLYSKEFVFPDTYEGTMEAYPITIQFVDAVRGRVVSLTNIQGGVDLFTDMEQEKSDSDARQAVAYLKEELMSEPNNQEIKDAIEYLEGELNPKYDNGGEIKYYEVAKDDKAVLVARIGKGVKGTTSNTLAMLDSLADRGYKLKEISKGEYKSFDYTAVSPDDLSEFTSGCELYEKGGKIEFDKFKVPSIRIYNYAKKIKKEQPKIWAKGGNIFGNQAFKNLERVIKRGYWLETEKWMFIKWRGYVARHKQDFRIEGVVAMLKWIDEVDKGFSYMKDLIEETVSDKKEKMCDGGEAVNDNAVSVEAKTVSGLSFDFNVNKDLTLDEVVKLAKDKSVPQNLAYFKFKGTKYTIENEQ